MARERLEFEIDGDSKGFSKAMDAAARSSRDLSNILNRLARDGGADAERQLDDVGDSMSEMGRDAARAAKHTTTLSGGVTKLALQFNLVDRAIDATVRALSAMGRVVVDAHRDGIALNLSFQTMAVRLEGVIGSARGAQQALAAFRQIAATTAFSVQDVSEAGTTLAAFMGGEFTSNIQGTTKAVADLAAFMGLSATEAASAMGRAFAGGAGAADILRERGVLNLIKSFKGIDDLTKLTLPQFREALLDTMVNTAGPIAGATDRMSATTVGALSNMGDAWQNFTARLTEGAMPQISEFARAMTDIFTTAGETITGDQGLAGAISSITKTLQDNKDAIATSIVGIADAVSTLADALAQVIALGSLVGQIPGQINRLAPSRPDGGFSGQGIALGLSHPTDGMTRDQRDAWFVAQDLQARYRSITGRSTNPADTSIGALRVLDASQAAQNSAQALGTLRRAQAGLPGVSPRALEDSAAAASGGASRRDSDLPTRRAARSLLTRTPDLALRGLRATTGPSPLLGGTLPTLPGSVRRTLEDERLGAKFREDERRASLIGFDRGTARIRSDQADYASGTEAGIASGRAFLQEMAGADFVGVAESVSAMGGSLSDLHGQITGLDQGGDKIGGFSKGIGVAADMFQEFGAVSLTVLRELTGGFQGLGGQITAMVASLATGDVAGFVVNGVRAIKSLFVEDKLGAEEWAIGLGGSLTSVIQDAISQGLTGPQTRAAMDQFVRQMVAARLQGQIVDQVVGPALKELGEFVRVAIGPDNTGARRSAPDVTNDPEFIRLLGNVNRQSDVAASIAGGAQRATIGQASAADIAAAVREGLVPPGSGQAQAAFVLNRNPQLLGQAQALARGVPRATVAGGAGDAATPAGLTVTTISGGFRDVLQSLGNRRDNLLTEIRDAIRGVSGGVDFGGGQEPAFAGAGGGGGTTIVIENVNVQQVADLGELDAVIAGQFDVGLGRRFAKTQRRSGTPSKQRRR